MNTIDPITLEMFWRRFNSTVDELAATLKRTSFSTVVRDVNDYAAAIFDSERRLLAQSPESTPGLCGPLGSMLRHMLIDNPPEELVEGDVLIGNNPWHGSGHHNDITVATPVFLNGRIIGYCVTCCHHVDIGGRRATIESRDNYEEGLRIPHVKIFKAGVLDKQVLAFIQSNVRSAETVLGDLRAQFAANHVGAERMKTMCSERGWDDLQLVADEMIARSEVLARDEIRKIPNGVYKSVSPVGIDDGEEVTIVCTVTIDDDEIEIDFTGTSPQVRTAINCTFTYACSYTTFAVNAILELPIKMNEGTLRPLTIKAEPGSILNCNFPAPVFARTSIGNYMAEVVFAAIAEAMPDRITAGAGSTPMWGQYFFGKRQDGGGFAPLNVVNGGLGARPDRDGVSCLSFPVNVGNTPIEVLENDVPIMIHQRALWPDSAGAGEYRGGFGQLFEVEVLKNEHGPVGDILTSFRAGRLALPVPGFLGGESAPKGELIYNGVAQYSGIQRNLKPGDHFLCRIPGGGGLGDPAKRDPERIRRDIEHGLVSEAFAAEHYGYGAQAGED
jgi:N-methylhydantoinase B/oxoprolinase/acetone carboxylase alpha subunit